MTEVLTKDQAWVFARRQVERGGGDSYSASEARFNKLPGTVWAKEFYSHLFTRPFASYQEDFWEWIDSIEPKKRERPRIECEPRGVGKSTNSEVAVAKLVATRVRRMIGYVSLDQEKSGKHFDSVKTLFESEKLQQVYPHCKPKIQKLRNIAAQWSRDAIVTESGAMVVPLTLLGSSRGWKSSEGSRFDCLVLDDVDKLGQSPEVIRKLLDLLKGEILAAGQGDTIVWMPQNLIHRDSICQKIRDQRADILSDRIFVGAYPLMKWYDAEKQDIKDDDTGAKKWVITAGEVFDEALDIPYCESLLNSFGKETFDRECQQEVFKVSADKDFREWDEVYHIITYSEFRAFWETYSVLVWNEKTDKPQIPHNWNVGEGMDWGTTPGHPTAIASVARPNMNVPLNDSFFAFAETVLPEYPMTQHEEVPLVSPGRVALALQKTNKRWNVSDRQIRERLMSHEASAALNTMAIDLKPELKTFYGKWQAKKGSGVPQIQNLLEINKSKPHPFRRYPKGHELEGEPLMGCPRMFWLVPDDQGKLTTDFAGKLFVAQPTNAEGFARARFEIPLYSHRNTGQNKIDDDYVDGARGLMNIFGVIANPLTQHEIEEAKLPERFKDIVIAKQIKEGVISGNQVAKRLDSRTGRQALLATLEDMKKSDEDKRRW